MAFLDDIQSSFGRGLAGAGRTAEIVKIKARMSDVAKRRENLAAQLGASLYEATRGDESLRAGREALYDGIAGCDEERARCQAELDALELASAQASRAGAYDCPFCHARMAASDLFCVGCGRPVAEVRQALAAQAPPPVAAPASAARCPSCGASVQEGDVFCMSCGSRIDPGAPVAPCGGDGPLQGGE